MQKLKQVQKALTVRSIPPLHNRLPPEKLGDTHPFFHYTSGRWLYNEQLRLRERRNVFDVDQLCRVVAQSVGRFIDDIILFKKIAEGGHNRVFEVTFTTGLRVIARLPYPSTIPKNYGVASEVATMEFLRIHGIPIPKVYEWSSIATNPVGSEYIIMERVEGRPLADTWPTMTVKQRITIMEQIVRMEKLLFGIYFPASGSLFFNDSLHADIKRVEMPKTDGVEDVGRFCIGPSTEYMWWYQKRDEITADRGPCKYTPL